MSARRIEALVIEDEASLQDAIFRSLQIEGIEALGLSSVEAANEFLKWNTAQVFIVDLNLPGLGGLEWLADRGRDPTTGVIVITGRNRENDRLRARELGADDFLAKPLDLEELVITVKNLLTRIATPASEWELDLTTWTLTAPDGRILRLTASELAFLTPLAESPGEPIDRRLITSYLTTSPDYYDMRRLEVLVRRLRKKISDTMTEPMPIQTARGVGYSFSAAIKVRGAK